MEKALPFMLPAWPRKSSASEVILDVKSINKNDAFVRGMMTWNVLNPILYSLDYWVFRFSNQQNGQFISGGPSGDRALLKQEHSPRLCHWFHSPGCIPGVTDF